MNFEERSEFLMQSIASHDKQIAELTDGLAETRVLLNDFISESREGTREMKLAISRLGTAMLALNEHSADHKARIERLEGGRT